MKLLSWLGANKLVAGAIGIGLVVIILVIVLFFRNVERGEIREEGNLRNQGAVEERSKGHEETFNAVINAQRPVTDAERNVVCSKYDRNCTP